MRLLQRYILGELLRTFAFLLGIVTVLLVFVGVFRQASESGLGPMQILQILPFVVPSLLPFTIPATLLLTVCAVYGRIAADHEVTATKSAGINVLSLLWPAFLLAVVLSVCSMWLTDQVIPWAVGNIQKQIALALEDIFLDRLRSMHQVTDEKHGFSITVTGVDGKQLIRPSFKYTPDGRDPVIVQAQSATLEFDLDRRKVILHLVRGHIDIPGERRVWFEREDQPFPLPYDLPKPKARHLSVREIRDRLGDLRTTVQQRQHHRNAETALALALNNVERLWQNDLVDYEFHDNADRRRAAKFHTEIHSRTALATSCLFFVLLGAPFAILQGRRQFLTSFMLCFGPILLIYYPLVLLMMNLSKSGTVNPAWAMWVPNVILLGWASQAMYKVLKH